MPRDSTTNPFEAGADRVPAVWAGRTEQIADFRDRVWARRRLGLGETGRTILGDPGIGKSVLVRRMAAEVTAAGGWDTGQVRVPAGADPVPLLAQALTDIIHRHELGARFGDRGAELLGRLRSVSFMGAGVTTGPVAGPSPHVTLTETLIRLGRLARERNIVVMVHVDEVQNVTDANALSQLLIALGDALAHDDDVPVPGGTTVPTSLPLLVYLTALPEFHDLASSRTGATFSRRFGTQLLQPLTDDDVAASLRPFITDGWPVPDVPDGVVRLAPAAVDRIVALSHGDPYLFQLLGQHAWDARADQTISTADVDAGWKQATPQARRHIERLLDRLPELERRFIEAMAALPAAERNLTRIGRELGYDSSSQLGPTAQRLDTVRGLIERHGSRRPYTFRIGAVEGLLTDTWP